MTPAARFRSYGLACLVKARARLSRPRQRPLSRATVRAYTRGLMNQARFWFSAAARDVLVRRSRPAHFAEGNPS